LEFLPEITKHQLEIILTFFDGSAIFTKLKSLKISKT